MKRKHGVLKTLLKINICAAGGLALINHLITAQSSVKNILKPDMGSFFHWKFGNVFYRVEGRGEQPVLLIHDANVYSSGYEWNNLVDRLRKEYRVYTLDLPGCARSDKPALTYTNYMYVQLLTAFIENVIKEKVILAAAGISASFAVMTAHAHPELVGELKLINPLSLRQLSAVPDVRSRLIRAIFCLPVIGTSIYHIFCSRQNLEYYLDDKHFYNPFHVTRKMLDACYEASHIGEGRGKYLQASKDGRYLNLNINHALRSMSVPVTIAFGEHYPHMQEIGAQYKSLLPDVKIKTIKGTKEMPHIENPAELAMKLF